MLGLCGSWLEKFPEDVRTDTPLFVCVQIYLPNVALTRELFWSS